MSYDLYFWREGRKTDESASVVCERLGNDEDVEGVEHLSVELLKARFLESFPTIEDEGAQLNWEGHDSYFQVSWSVSMGMGKTQMIVISCGFKLLDDENLMNRIIDVGQSLGCALYDPQVGQRFHQSEPRSIKP